MSSCDDPQKRTEECKGDECEEDRQPDRAAETDAEQGSRSGSSDPREGHGALRERAQAAQRAAGGGERQQQPRQERAQNREDALGKAQERVTQSLADPLALAQPEQVAPRAQEQVACVVRDEEHHDRDPPGRAGERERESEQQADGPEPGPHQAISEAAEGAAHRGLEAVDQQRIRTIRLELRDRAEGDGREVGVAVEERRVALERLAEPGRVPPVARTEERQEREREPGADERTVVPRPLDRERPQEDRGADEARGPAQRNSRSVNPHRIPSRKARRRSPQPPKSWSTAPMTAAVATTRRPTGETASRAHRGASQPSASAPSHAPEAATTAPRR